MTWCGLPEALSQPHCYVAGVDLLKTFVNNKTNAFLRILQESLVRAFGQQH